MNKPHRLLPADESWVQSRLQIGVQDTVRGKLGPLDGAWLYRP